MAADKNYDRPKVVGINDTPINLTIFVAEKPDSVGAIGGTGTTAILDATFKADADESGGADVQDHAEFTITPTVDKVTGKTQYQVDFTPINGGGADGVKQTHVFDHDELMDAWQSAAGRARQA